MRAGLVGLLTPLCVSSTQALWTAFCLRVWRVGVGGGGVLTLILSTFLVSFPSLLFLWLQESRPPAPFSLRPKDSRLLPLLSQTQESGPPPPLSPGSRSPHPKPPTPPGLRKARMGNRHRGGADVQSAPPAHHPASPGGRQAGDLLM